MQLDLAGLAQRGVGGFDIAHGRFFGWRFFGWLGSKEGVMLI
jgi:hypothetical protein